MEYYVIGTMSGSSLDGFDVVYACFNKTDKWNFKILFSKCYKYSKKWKDSLVNARSLNDKDLQSLHNNYGILNGEFINDFIRINKIDKNDIYCVSSHGHTIFHEPDKKINFQLGNGAYIAKISNLKVVCDFRTKDISLGGQGAPLVPIGDKLLFSEFDYCLNIGGIANISFNKDGKTIAGDLCFANMASNYLIQSSGLEYDDGGNIARSGQVNNRLVEELNCLPFFNKSFPKSLAIEDFNSWFKPVLDKYEIANKDKLASLGEHLAFIISNNIPLSKTLLISGGGAYNDYWVSLLINKYNINCVLPSNDIIEYKEALIFAFLGLLKLQNKINVLSSYTGAKKDCSSGVVYEC